MKKINLAISGLSVGEWVNNLLNLQKIIRTLN